MNYELELMLLSTLMGSFVTLFILDILKFGISVQHIMPMIVGIVIVYVMYKEYKESKEHSNVKS